MQHDDYTDNAARMDALLARPHTEIPDLSGYTAWTSFAPVVTEAKQRLYRLYKTADARAAHLVLEGIAECASNLGVTFQLSQNALEKRTHLRRNNVRDGMNILVDLNYVRQHVTPLPVRRTVQTDWQISPYVLHIGPLDVFDAFQLWRNSHQIDTACIFTHTESRIRESRRFNQTPHPDPTPRTPLKGKGAGNVDKWDEVAIDQCREPLQISSDENTAQSVATLCRMHVSQARRLVLTYGSNAVNTAFVNLTERQKTENIIRPGGALVTALRRDHGRPAEAAAAGGD